MFGQGFPCPALLVDPARAFPYGAVTRSGPPFQTVLVTQRKAAGLVPVRSPLLGESRLMSVPPATEMFQFAGFASRPYEFRSRYPGTGPGWVAPFGDPGINDRSHLPRAFRSVPRPSSPLSAKASTRCPSLAPARTQRQGPSTGPPGARPSASLGRHFVAGSPASARSPARSHNSLLHNLPSAAPAPLAKGGPIGVPPRPRPPRRPKNRRRKRPCRKWR